MGERACTIALLCAVTIVLVQSSHAQTFNVLYTFSGGQDGNNPAAGVTIDRGGNLYGTAQQGGNTGGNCGTEGCGTVFKLVHRGSQWMFTPLYRFQGGADGSSPTGRVIFGPDGRLYGVAGTGGAGCGTGGCGVAYRLHPQATICKATLCLWNESVIQSFNGSDGALPEGDLVFDQAGNIYGTLNYDGAYGDGSVYQLVPSNGGFSENVLYSFAGSSDGAFPAAGVVLDTSGNLYGTTPAGGNQDGYGVVYQLTHSGGNWAENVLHTFDGSDGRNPSAAPIFDAAGNLYGTTTFGGFEDSGTAFELTSTGGGWNFTSIYGFSGSGGPGPGGLVQDSAGNLYGAAGGCGGSGCVFKLTPTGNGWEFTPLYYFTGRNDGAGPGGTLAIDSSGNLYGTTTLGGNLQCNHGFGCGVVFEITP